MTRQRLIAHICWITLFAQPLAAHAQTDHVSRIGFLAGVSADHFVARLAAFRQELRKLGYVEGQNLRIEYRYADHNRRQLAAFAAELVHDQVSVIVTSGNAPTAAARHSSTTIPIVVAIIGDLVGPGFAASLAHPGGNVTGLISMSPDLAGKRLELIRDLLPSASCIGVVWNPRNPVKKEDLAQMEAATKSLGLTLRSAPVQKPEDFAPVFKAMAGEHTDAVVILADGFVNYYSRRMVDLATKFRLPTVFGLRGVAKAGGLISYAPSDVAMFRRAAVYFVKILKGAKAGNLPIERPSQFELVINLKTARGLGITVPRSILARADQVIE
jgi:ABC-type uncharacterized transport system substrate-binding protein